jgi:ubiquitin-conjugating enzyme E2 O
MRPLQRGEVGVSFFTSGKREILPESEFRLVDRSFHIGDLCKRSIDDVRSGVVTNVHVKAKLEHAISGAQVDGWKTIDDVRPREQAEIGDFVIYDDWVGQVCVALIWYVLSRANASLGGRGESSSLETSTDQTEMTRP